MNTKLIGSLPKYLAEKYKELYYSVESGKSPFTLVPPSCENYDCKGLDRPVVCSYYPELDKFLFLCMPCLKKFDRFDVTFTAISQVCESEKCSTKWPLFARRDGSTMAFTCLPCTHELFQEEKTRH